MLSLFQRVFRIKIRPTALMACLLLIVSSSLNAAGVDVIGIEKIILKKRVNKLYPYVITIGTNSKEIDQYHLKQVSKLNTNLVYITKVEGANDQYFRLVSGNFKTRAEALKALPEYKKYYKDAWINYRTYNEKVLLKDTIKQWDIAKSQPQKPKIEKVLVKKTKNPLKELNNVAVVVPDKSAFEDRVKHSVVALSAKAVTWAPTLKSNKQKEPNKLKKSKKSIKPNQQGIKSAIKKPIDFAQKLLAKMKGYFLDGLYARVVSSANKVIEIGNEQQQQKAMELMGVARERQGKFAQAVAVYNEFNERFPKSPLSKKVNNRLIGLKTMRLEPKKRLVKRKPRILNTNWTTFGSLSQYYRHNLVENTVGTQTLNSSFVSDLNMIARKSDDNTRLDFRFDGGMTNNLLDSSSDLRISRAMFSYTDKAANYKVVSGRQSRTAKGVLGRFDGLVFTKFSDTDFNYSIFTGFPVLSSFDSINTDSQFYGGSINFNVAKNMTTDIYAVQQTIDGLTDRQAIGSEVQYINEKGFFYGILDYDIFYGELNNMTLISNYRYNNKLSFNATLDYRNAPLLMTLNALQGQTANSINELKKSFSNQEIYNLAQDRTSKSTNIFLGTSYQIDDTRQLYGSISYSTTKATKSSAGVIATAASNNLYLSMDYTVKSYFDWDDYSTIGARFSQSTSAETFSINSRTQFSDHRKIRYKPKFNIDYRKNKSTDIAQWILKPSLKMNYKYDKKISFEGEFGVELSDFILPEQDKQTSFNLYMGYLYQF